MSGHSKWSTIKRKKGALDAKRGKLFTRAIHELSVAVKEGGGGDPDGNPRLRTAIDRAKAVNMSNDTIDRAIKRASGDLKGDVAQELVYEGYGPGGSAVLVEVLTDNKNRTVSDVRHAFTRAGGTLGESGCVVWMFTKKGVVLVRRELISEEKLMEVALEAGASDVTDEGEVWEVVCEPSEFNTLRSVLEKVVALDSSEVTMIANTRVRLDKEGAEKMVRFIETLEELDDVLNVVSNCDFPEEI